MIKKIKDWLIRLLGGFTKSEMQATLNTVDLLVSKQRYPKLKLGYMWKSNSKWLTAKRGDEELVIGCQVRAGTRKSAELAMAFDDDNDMLAFVAGLICNHHLGFMKGLAQHSPKYDGLYVTMRLTIMPDTQEERSEAVECIEGT